MNDLLAEICKTKVYNFAKDKDNTYYNVANRAKNVRKVLRNKGLYDFIENYKEGKTKAFNHEWIDVFNKILELVEFDGTTKKENPGRHHALHDNITINNSFTIINAELFEVIVKAIKSGDTPDIHLQELKHTDFYNKCLISSYEFAIIYNYKTLFDDLEANFDKLSECNIKDILHKIKSNSTILFDELIEGYETLDGTKVKETLLHFQDNYRQLLVDLQLPFSPLITKMEEVI